MVRFKLLITLVAGVLLVAGCDTRDRSLSGRVAGTWQGEAVVEQMFTDSDGFSFVQNFNAPAELVYTSDSTLLITVMVSETNHYKLEGSANTDGDRLVFTGKLSMGEVLDARGELSLTEDNQIILSYHGNSEVGIDHKAKSTMIRLSR